MALNEHTHANACIHAQVVVNSNRLYFSKYFQANDTMGQCFELELQCEFSELSQTSQSKADYEILD